MALSANSTTNIRDTLTLDSAGDEFIAAIKNASALSNDTMSRLIGALTDPNVAKNVQNAILGSSALSPNDIYYLGVAFAGDSHSANDIADDIANNVAGGIIGNAGIIHYPSVPTAQVATPAFSVPAGPYGPTQSVSLSCSTPRALMYYTTDGSTPTTGSTLYTGTPISVSSSETIKVLAVSSGFINSAIASAAYVINGAVATPTLDPVAGSYVGTQSVTISSSTSGATFYYTTDGSTPTVASTLYSGAISVAVSETIKVLGVKANFINSAIASAAYVIS